jgi:hypothetical protein
LCRPRPEGYDTIDGDNELRMSREPDSEEVGMLVLSRKLSQQAPRGITVLREELLGRLECGNGSEPVASEWRGEK